MSANGSVVAANAVRVSRDGDLLACDWQVLTLEEVSIACESGRQLIADERRERLLENGVVVPRGR